MRCERCGQDIKENLTFCSKCGHSFNKPSQKRSSVVPAIVSAVIVVIVVGTALFAFLPKEGVNRSQKKDRTETIKQEEVSEDTQKSESQENDEIYTVIEEPKYDALEIRKHNLHIEYPEHFIQEKSDDENIILSLKDPNGVAALEFMVFETGQKVLTSEVLSKLKNEIYNDDGMKVLDEVSDDSRFMQKSRYKNSIIYSYGISTDTEICMFAFSYAEFEAHVYEKYFEHISDKFYKIDDVTK